MNKDDSFQKLQYEINNRIKVAADSLLRNDKNSAKENIEWIELATNLVDKTRKRPNKVKLPLIIGLFSILLIGLGLIIRVPKTKISVDVITDNVSFIVKKQSTINNRFSSSALSISNLKEVSWPGANIHITNEQPFALELKGQDITIDKFDLDSNAELTIRLENNLQNFIIKNSSLVIDIQAGKAHLNINDGQLDTMLNSEIPQLFKVGSFKSRTMPVKLVLSDTGRWRIRDILISDIHFLEESLPGSGKFISSITSGSIKLLEIEKEVKLEEGDWLVLEDLNISRIHFTKSGSDLKIHIEGDVDRASAGSELFEKNLNPTIIEYLYYAKSFAFFWSCIIFIWSLLWSFKNTLFFQ